jgi:hypothetical protein
MEKMNDSDYYRLAAEEIEAGETHKGAWLLALEQADGNTNLQQAEYMKIRVQMILEKESSAKAQKIINPAIVKSSQKPNYGTHQSAKIGVVIFVIGLCLSFLSMAIDSAFLIVIGGLMTFVGAMTWGLLSQ